MFCTFFSLATQLAELCGVFVTGSFVVVASGCARMVARKAAVMHSSCLAHAGF
jgi:hypothetical protein